MKADQSRPDALLGATLVTLALVLSYTLRLPLYLFAPFLLTGVVLMGEGIYTTHNAQVCLRRERRYETERKAPPVVVTGPSLRQDAEKLMRDWSLGRPTTRTYAESVGVGRQRWEQIIDLAARSHLGHLERAQGGNPVLRWTASLDQAITTLGNLG